MRSIVVSPDMLIANECCVLVDVLLLGGYAVLRTLRDAELTLGCDSEITTCLVIDLGSIAEVDVSQLMAVITKARETNVYVQVNYLYPREDRHRCRAIVKQTHASPPLSRLQYFGIDSSCVHWVQGLAYVL